MAHMGLDVGYGTSKRSCGLAVRGTPGANPNLGALFQDRIRYIHAYQTNGGGVVEAVTLYKDREVIPQAVGLRRLLGGAILVVDGMLAPRGRPVVARHVDSSCMRGEFQNRAVPASVEGAGQQLVNATYEILEAVFGAPVDANLAFTPTLAHAQPGPRVLETNPTIGLAVSVAMVQNIDDIPSRHAGGGPKSDYYWQRGGGHRVADVLGAPTVAAERNRELRAGLFALAVAVQVSGTAADGSNPVFIGDPATGIYVLLGPVHPDWQASVDGVGIVP